MTAATFVLEPGRLSLAALRRIEGDGAAIALAPECRDAVEQARDLVNAIVEAGTPTYGVNTGLGTLSSRSIAPEDLEEMQSRILLSNAAGTGALLSEAVVRRLMLLKIATLATGRSGVRPELIDALVSLYNAGVTPCIPSKGSVGASGDLAPLAHLGVALLGEGEVRCEGETLPAAEGLARAGLEPLRLAPKEGLARIRETVPPYDRDRFLAPEIAAIKDLVRGGAFVDAVPATVRLTA